MNSEERASLIYRIPTLQYNENSPIQLVKTFGDFMTNAFSQCGQQDTNCLNNLMVGQISQMVKTSPFYQKQCGSN